jgi:hypothetical protein
MSGAKHFLDRVLGVGKLNLTAGAESGNAIPVTVQLANPDGTAKGGAVSWHVEAVGELTAAYRLAVSGSGAVGLSTTAKSQLAFTTATGGGAVITVTDVSGSSTATVLLAFRPLDGLGLPQYIAVTFA